MKGESFTPCSSGKTWQVKAFVPSPPMKRELLVPSGVIKVKRTKALEHESSRMGLVGHRQVRAYQEL